jgi:glycosyltransferase involved in cell wall biosynthesis
MLVYHRAKKTWRDEVDVYIALTEFARGKFVEAGLPAHKIIVKPNFVDPDPGVGPGDGDFALFVGRLTEEKGVRTLLNAWQPVFARTGAPLKIAGDGPMRSFVEDFCRSATGIEFLGRRPLNEVYELMGRARGLAFPSEWYEGLPKTIVEAFAKGTPVIASRLGSMTELVEPGQTGYLFTARNQADLASKAEQLLSQGASERQTMREAARSEFESKYTADRNYPLLEAAYERAVSGPIPSPSPA